jgi:hypothetical protein
VRYRFEEGVMEWVAQTYDTSQGVFDPTQIRAIGGKIAIGDGSTATYKGPIYLDSVEWP